MPDFKPGLAIFVKPDFNSDCRLRGPALNPKRALKGCLKATGLVLTDIDVSEVLIKVK